MKTTSSSHDHEHHGQHPPTGRPERASEASHAHTTVAPTDHEGHEAHDRHAGHSVEMFRDRFWITLALTIPTLVWSDMIQNWFGFREPSFPGSE
jgi:Cu2+-exporting ATPase